MISSCASKRIISKLLQVFLLAICGLSIADPLTVNPPVVEAGGVATVSGSGIQPGAKMLVWGGSSLVSNVNLTGNAFDVAVSGNYALVIADNAGVHVVDITDHRNPGLVTSVATKGNAQSIYISGNYAYVDGGTGGQEIIDISNQESPVLLSSSQTGSATGASVSASYAYVANGQQHIIPARFGDLDSLVLYVSLNDRNKDDVGTNIDVAAGPGNLQLAEIDAGNLVVPGINYNVENNFGSNGGTMTFPRDTVYGPLIAGDREDYKALLIFGNRAAIISFWLDSDTSLSGGETIVSAGPDGTLSSSSGGWSV